jgi:hypothetical protein
MSDFEAIANSELQAATGGAEDTFKGTGTTTQSTCFAKLGRGIAHSYDATGPWRPRSHMRPDDHLIVDKQRNEVGVATWQKDPNSTTGLGQCKVLIY